VNVESSLEKILVQLEAAFLIFLTLRSMKQNNSCGPRKERKDAWEYEGRTLPALGIENLWISDFFPEH